MLKGSRQRRRGFVLRRAPKVCGYRRERCVALKVCASSQDVVISPIRKIGVCPGANGLSGGAVRPRRWDPNHLRGGIEACLCALRSADNQNRDLVQKGYQRSDAAARGHLVGGLTQARYINSGDRTLSVSDVKVMLEGTVPERRMKHSIEDLIVGCPGV